MSVFFTIKDLSDHLLGQLMMTDAEYQIKQRLMASEIKREFNLSRTSTHELTPDDVAGLGSLNKLHLSEAEFSFGIVPVRETFWVRIKRSFNSSFPEPGHLFRFASKKRGEFQNTIDVRIVVKRDLSGTFKSDIDLPPSITQNPDEIYVSGLT